MFPPKIMQVLERLVPGGVGRHLSKNDEVPPPCEQIIHVSQSQKSNPAYFDLQTQISDQSLTFALKM